MTYELLHMDAIREGIGIGEEKGRKEGRAEGREEGKMSTLVQLVRDGLLDIKEACKRMSMTEQEFSALLK